MRCRMIALVLALCLAAGNALAANGPIPDDAWETIRQNLENNVEHPVPEQYRITVGQEEMGAAWQEKDTLSILVMGTDAAAPGQDDGQADVVMVCTVSLNTGAVRLLSLPESKNVSVDGVPEEVWLKYVHCIGGPGLMVKAVNGTLELPVVKYCAVNLNSFVTTLDKLGGVTMDLSAYEAEALGLAPGETLLNGSQALDYVKLSGESDRQARARALLTALARQVMGSLSLRTVGTLLNFMITAIDTNLTYDNLMDVVFAVLDSDNGLSITTGGIAAFDGNAAEYCRDFLYGE